MRLSSKEFIAKKDKEWSVELEHGEGPGIPMKDIGRKGRHFFKREAWTFMPQWNLADKVFVIERLRKVRVEGETSYDSAASINEIEYRIGYYIVGKIGKKLNRWTWGQYCPLIPQQDFGKLFNKAKKEGTII